MPDETPLFNPPPVDCEALFSLLRGYEQYRLASRPPHGTSRRASRATPL